MGWNGDGLPASASWLYLPTGLALAPDGDPCVVDFNNFRVRCLRAGRLDTIAGNGFHEYAAAGTPWLEAPMDNPIDAEWSPDGRLTLIPVHEGRVLQDDGTGRVRIIAGTGEEGYAGDGGPATEAVFAQPGGMAYSADGALWIADTQNGAVRRIDPAGIVSTVLAGVPGVQRVRAGFGDGVLVADTFGGRVLDLQPDGSVEVLLSDLSYPWSARLGHDGAIYVASSGENQVLRWAEGTVDVLAGTGTAGFAGDGGPAVDAELAWPADTLLLDDGTLLIADMQNGRLRSLAGAAAPAP
jgi:hypothetical protein